MSPNARIYIAGHSGLVGSALCRALTAAGYTNLITRTHAELDLTDAQANEAFFAREKPEYVFIAAARVGGILANNEFPADFIRDNLAIETNLITAAHRHAAARLLFFGASCIYPRFAEQPIREDSLLTGPLEATNRPYALAKIAGIEMCWSYNRQHGTRFLSVMPASAYGPNDNFSPENSHVLPALIRRFTEAVRDRAELVTLWGTGTALREFLYSDDLADACLFLMNLDDAAFDDLLGKGIDHQKVFQPPLINIGSGTDLPISQLAARIAQLAGFEGRIDYDTSKPDGTPRKLLDNARIAALGWQPKVSLDAGLRLTMDHYLATPGQGRR
jgi:GDP-L-fucose synthase